MRTAGGLTGATTAGFARKSLTAGKKGGVAAEKGAIDAAS